MTSLAAFTCPLCGGLKAPPYIPILFIRSFCIRGFVIISTDSPGRDDKVRNAYQSPARDHPRAPCDLVGSFCREHRRLENAALDELARGEHLIGLGYHVFGYPAFADEQVVSMPFAIERSLARSLEDSIYILPFNSFMRRSRACARCEIRLFQFRGHLRERLPVFRDVKTGSYPNPPVPRASKGSHLYTPRTTIRSPSGNAHAIAETKRAPRFSLGDIPEDIKQLNDMHARPGKPCGMYAGSSSEGIHFDPGVVGDGRKARRLHDGFRLDQRVFLKGLPILLDFPAEIGFFKAQQLAAQFRKQVFKLP